MGTIFGILFIAAIILMAIDSFKDGTEAANEGSGCSCLVDVFLY